MTTDQILSRARRAVSEIRRQAVRRGTDNLTGEEIASEIKTARMPDRDLDETGAWRAIRMRSSD